MHFLDPDQTQSSERRVNHGVAGNGPPPTTIRQAMQADHAAWQASLARWRDDAARWQAEHDSMRARLAALQRTVLEHGESLTAHESAFPPIDRALVEFGGLLAATPATMPPEAADPAATRHQEVAIEVRHVEETHGRMAKHHDEVMSRMRDLERAASAPL